MKLHLFGRFLLLAYFFTFCAGGPVKSTEQDDKLLEKFREMHSFINESVHPCEDFYNFTCGNWAKIYPANSDMQTHYLLVIQKAFNKKAMVILKDMKADDTDVDRIVKNFYKSCLKLKNGTTTEKLRSVISDFGKMPALSGKEWDEENFDWLETLAKIKHQYAFPIIIGLDISADMKDNSINRVYIGEDKFDLEAKSIYLDAVGESYREIYKTGIALKLKNFLGVDPEAADTVAEEIFQFEVLLAKGMQDNKSDKNISNLIVNTTVEALHQKYAPTIDIKKFFKIALGEIPEDMIYEDASNYLSNLKNVVEKTEKRIIANYIFYNLVKGFVLDASETDEELEINCLDKVKEQFARNIDNMIFRSFDSQAAEEDVSRIWGELKAQFRVKLESEADLNWMTEETRKKAIDKLNMLKLQINSYKDYDFKKEFEGLEINEDDYVGNLKQITALYNKRFLDKLHGPVTSINEGETLSFTPANILGENEVKIPVAILQPYYIWAPNFPDEMKFGLTGYLLAHELIHSFDENGRQFGKHGNLENWWDEKSEKEFNERKACFRDQYHKYIYGGRQLPLTEAQGENIADNSGLQLAYDTYMNIRKNSIETVGKQVGMDYTGQQLFFIAFGQFWCSDLRSGLRNFQTEVDEHTPEKYRTIGTVSNLKEFAEAFECKEGSEMNSVQKCKMY